jgi:hypothetical protein
MARETTKETTLPMTMMLTPVMKVSRDVCGLFSDALASCYTECVFVVVLPVSTCIYLLASVHPHYRTMSVFSFFRFFPNIQT